MPSFKFFTTVIKLARQPQLRSSEGWCPWRESNPHALRRAILSRVRLPVPPHGLAGHLYNCLAAPSIGRCGAV
jgi:hypothetical protein